MAFSLFIASALAIYRILQSGAEREQFMFLAANTGLLLYCASNILTSNENRYTIFTSVFLFFAIFFCDQPHLSGPILLLVHDWSWVHLDDGFRGRWTVS